MSNSPLVVFTKLSPNCTKPRNRKIDTITIHYMACDGSIEAIGNAFAKTSRQASSNYGIGSDGRVGMYVEECNRSWCSSSGANDHRAITIEVANYPDSSISEKAMTSLINLCVDICKRNGIEKLNYTGNTNGNLTMHKWFANTSCPGAYLESKFPYIAEEVNKRLGGNEENANKELDKNEEVKTVMIEMPILKKGANCEEVKTLQVLLNGFNKAGLAVDGLFGQATDKAVRNYQRSRGLDVDGICGPATWNRILK